MQMQNFLDTTHEHSIPTGGEFTPSGMISLWNAAMLYTFMAQVPLPAEFQGRDDVFSVTRSGWTTYYFKDQVAAKEACTQMGLYDPNLIWHFETANADVLNFSGDARSKFGETIGYDLRVASLQSKYRHVYHMIALPAAVDAWARCALNYETSGFDLGELIGTSEEMFTDRFWFSMVGNPDAKEGEDDHYTNSVLWKRRAELWASLGEDNPKAFRLKGAGTSFDTVSDKLSNAFGIANYPWKNPMWAKIVTVANPKTDEVTKDGKRLNIPTIFEIYNDRESALADVPNVSEGISAPATTSATPAASGTLAVPAAWKESPNEWPEYLRQFKSQNPGLNPIVINKATSELSVTEQELRAWWDQV